MLSLEGKISVEYAKRLVTNESLSTYISKLSAIQDNLLRASAEELL